MIDFNEKTLYGGVVLTKLQYFKEADKPTLLEKFWRISLYIFDWWHFYFALCEVKFRQIEGNLRKFCLIELSISVICLIF